MSSLRLKFTNVKGLLEEGLSLHQNGIMIALFILNDQDPEILWAKFKAKITVNLEVKADLIRLHEKNLIEWSDVDLVRTKLKEDKITPEVIELVDYINSVWKTSYSHKNKSVFTPIISRLKTYSIDDIKSVITNRYHAWKDDSMMSRYLRIDTVFRPSKFENYLQDAKRTGIGQATATVLKFDLKTNTQLTIKHLKMLSDEELYEVRCCPVRNGVLSTLGSRIERLQGKNIKRNLQIFDNSLSRGFSPDFIYVFLKVC